MWRDIHATFDFADEPHRLVLVEDACRTADIVDKLQSVIDDAGTALRSRGSMGQEVSVPELAEVRLQRKALVDLLRALALPDAEDGAIGLFGSSAAGQRGARARWDRVSA